MGRKSIAAVVVVVVAPLAVGLMVNLFTPWLTTNAGAVGSVLTSPWLPWGLYAVMGALWLYYWLVIVARRIAPQARLQRINDLFAEQEAIRAIVQPNTSPTPPRGMDRRVARFRRDVGKVIGSDSIYRDWLNTGAQYDTIRAETLTEPDGRARWRAAILVMVFQSDEILRDLQSRLSPEGRRSLRRTTRDR